MQYARFRWLGLCILLQLLDLPHSPTAQQPKTWQRVSVMRRPYRHSAQEIPVIEWHDCDMHLVQKKWFGTVILHRLQILPIQTKLHFGFREHLFAHHTCTPYEYLPLGLKAVEFKHRSEGGTNSIIFVNIAHVLQAGLSACLPGAHRLIDVVLFNLAFPRRRQHR
jgi:hypothetical protein